MRLRRKPLIRRAYRPPPSPRGRREARADGRSAPPSVFFCGEFGAQRLVLYSRASRRARNGASAGASSARLNRGVICCGQFIERGETVAVALGLRPVARRGELRGRLRIGGQIFDLDMRIVVEAATARIIHQDKGGAIVGGEIAGADILAVAAKVGDAERLSSRMWMKPGGPPRCCT